MSIAEACLGRAQPAPSQGTSCNQIRVALISGHPLYREGFARILRTAGNMAFVEGVYAADAVAIARERAADVVVIDLYDLADANMDMVLELARNYPEVRVAVLGDAEHVNEACTASEKGISGYILKTVQGSELVDIIRTIHAGGTYVSPRPAAGAALSKSSRQRANEPRRFTPREEEIFALVARGKTNKEIARVLNVAEKTVKHHMTIILQKMNARNRLEAVMTARREARRPCADAED
jgi:DNA-binding NarL/FixJ family response regulator